MGWDSRSATPWTTPPQICRRPVPDRRAIVRKGVGYDFYWYGVPSYEKEDIARLKAFLGTFTFTGGRTPAAWGAAGAIGLGNS